MKGTITIHLKILFCALRIRGVISLGTLFPKTLHARPGVGFIDRNISGSHFLVSVLIPALHYFEFPKLNENGSLSSSLLLGQIKNERREGRQIGRARCVHQPRDSALFPRIKRSRERDASSASFWGLHWIPRLFNLSAAMFKWIVPKLRRSSGFIPEEPYSFAVIVALISVQPQLLRAHCMTRLREMETLLYSSA